MAEKKQIPCEVYSRIVGYFRPVRNWNKGKQKEFSERKVYTIAAEPETVVVHEDKSAR